MFFMIYVQQNTLVFVSNFATFNAVADNRAGHVSSKIAGCATKREKQVEKQCLRSWVFKNT